MPTERSRVLELFQAQKEFMEEKIHYGIEMYRKGHAVLTVKDSHGQPIKNAKIKITQADHAFKFGANLFMLDELETEEKNKTYKKIFADTFNMATLPFYWDATEPEPGLLRYEKDSPKLYRRPPIDLCMEYCKDHGIEPREHGLAYEHFFPKWLYHASVPEIKAALTRRYEQIAQRYRNHIPTIEVTNEMDWDTGNTAFYEDPDFVEWCFKTAETYFPGNQLVINDHTGLPWGDRCRTTDKYYSYIEANLLKGARIDAIGMQFHMFCRAEGEYEHTRHFYDPKKLYAHMDLYARFGLPLQITEVTIPAYSNNPEDEAIQAKILKTLYEIWFSHPNVEQIIYWNLVDGYAHVWDPDPETIKASQGNMTLGENYYYGGLLRFDMTPKPAFDAIRDLIKNKWHTEAEGTTDSCGQFSFKGFFGHYRVQIETVNGIQERTINLSSKASGRIELEV